MRFFVCLLDLNGRGISEQECRSYETLPRSRGLRLEWQFLRGVAVLIASDSPGPDPPLLMGYRDSIAVGTVRLDNRSDLEEWPGHQGQQLSDLGLVLRAISHSGVQCVPDLLGDYAFLVWNTITRDGAAVVDPFATKKLYYSESNGLLAFASRGEALARGNTYSRQYLAELVGACPPAPELTVYESVKAVPPGAMLVIQRQHTTTVKYWSARAFDVDPRWLNREAEAAESCRRLLTEAVQLRLTKGNDSWAQLSGGLDSSSVVSVSQSLLERGSISHGLAGTVTFVDTHGTGADEREYSDVVAARWRVRNEMIVDAPVWQDDHQAPPCLDEPSPGLILYPRDLRLCKIVSESGGRVLLTGVGGDLLFGGNMFFFADWLTSGRVWPALQEMSRRAAIGRASFWELAYRNALLPVLPHSLRHRLVKDAGQLPPWLHPAVVQRYELDRRAFASSSYDGRVGHKYHDAVVAGIEAIPVSIPAGLIEDYLDVRHPFLFRPLVEFALTLPAELCVRPYARKWVFREAMKGVLPEVVRQRVGKGAFYGLLAWSMTRQRELLEPLVRQSILAELGVVDGIRLRAVFDAAPSEPDGRQRLSAIAHHTLAVEAWLQMRSGQWPRETVSTT